MRIKGFHKRGVILSKAKDPIIKFKEREENQMDNKKELVLFNSYDGKVSLSVAVENETVWLTLDQLAELFGRNKSTVSRHITNIYDEGELDRPATVAIFATVQQEGKRQVERNIEYYNLDVIISVGYRVKSPRGVEFRCWATRY